MKNVALAGLLACSTTCLAAETAREVMLADWVQSLAEAIGSNLRPIGKPPEISSCRIRIVILPNGEVQALFVEEPCQSIPLLRNSMERAVLMSQPLPLPRDPSVFSHRITINFHLAGD